MEKDLLKNLIRKEYSIINADETLSKVIPMLEKWEERSAILVCENDEIIGVLRERDLIRGCAVANPHETKIKNFAIKTGIIPVDELSFSNVAKRFIEDSTPFVIVKLNSKKYGVISIDDFLNLIRSDLEDILVKEVMNPEVVTIKENETVAKALARMRNYGIDRIVVVDEQNKVVGIVTGKDIFDRIIRPKKKLRFGDLHGEKETLLILVKSVMSYPVITVEENDSVSKAIDIMVEKGISSLVVLDKKEHPRGILIKKDILENYIRRKIAAKFGIQVILRDLVLSKSEVERINKDLNEFMKKFEGYFRDAILFVYIKRHKESYRNMPLVYIRLRLSSDKGTFFATGEGWGAEYALHVTLKKLEREILEEKDLLIDKKMIKRFYEEVVSKF